MVKPALVEAAEGARKRGRTLAEQALTLQERLDAAAHLLTQRSQDQLTIAAQVPSLKVATSAERMICAWTWPGLPVCCCRDVPGKMVPGAGS